MNNNFGQSNPSAQNFFGGFGGMNQGGNQQSQIGNFTGQSTGQMNNSNKNTGGFMPQNSTSKKMKKKKSVSKQPQEQNFQQKQQGFVPGPNLQNQQTYMERNPANNPQISNFQAPSSGGFMGHTSKKPKSKTPMGQGGQQPAAPIAPSGGGGFMQTFQGGNKASIIGQMNQPNQLNKVRDFSNNGWQSAAAPTGGFFGGAAKTSSAGFGAASQGFGGFATQNTGFGAQSNNSSGFGAPNGNKSGGFGSQKSMGIANGGFGSQPAAGGFQNFAAPQNGGGFMTNSNNNSANGKYKNPPRGESDRGRGASNRGGSDIGRGASERGRGGPERGRGAPERGRGAPDRGRGMSDRGRGQSDRGMSRGSHLTVNGRGRRSHEPKRSPEERSAWNPRDQSGETFQTKQSSDKNLPKFLQNKKASAPAQASPQAPPKAPSPEEDNLQDEGYDDEDDEDDYDDYGEYGEEEQQELPERSEHTKKPCKFNMMGTCHQGADKCKYLHFDVPKISEEHCKFFVVGSQCKYEENCNLRHDPEYQKKFTQKMMQAMSIELKKQQMKKDFQKQNRAVKEPENEDIKNKNKGKNLNNLISTFEKNEPEKPIVPKTRPPEPKATFLAPAEPKPTFLAPPAPISAPLDPSFYCNSPSFIISRISKLLSKLSKIQASPGQYLIPNKAHCLMMCPQQHLDDEQRDKSHFELDQNGQQFELLAIKRYVKSDAGKEMDDPEIIRPPIVLYIVMKFMRDCIVDQDMVPPGQSFFQYMNQAFGEVKDLSVATQSFQNIYSFLMDRTRQISQDFSIINQQPNKYSVRCYEQLIRYLILAQHDGLSEFDFDFYTNLKRMTGWMGDLRQKQYLPVRQSKVMSPQEKAFLLSNEVEMLAYQIIASSEDFFELQKLLKDMNKYDYTPEQHKLLQEAIIISSTVQSNDYARFFRLFKSSNYMFSCLMLNFFERMRRQAMAEFGNPRLFLQQEVQGSFIMSALLLPDKLDCFNCIKGYGFSPNPQTCNFSPKNRQDADTWNTEIKKFRQQKLPIIDQKRNLKQDRLRRDFIKHGLKFMAAEVKVDPQAEARRMEIKRQQEEVKKRIEEQEKEKAKQAKIEQEKQAQLLKEAEIQQKKKQEQDDLRRTERFTNCFRRFAEKICRGQTKKLAHYAKKIRHEVKVIRHEKEKAIQKELERAARHKRKQQQQKQQVLFETILRENLSETRKLEEKKEKEEYKQVVPQNIFKQQKIILTDFQDCLNPFEIKDKDQISLSNYKFKFEKQKCLIERISEKVPQNEKAVLNVIMERTGQILDRSIKKVFTSEKENVIVNFSSSIVEDLIKCLKNRGFSILTLVVDEFGFNFDELVQLSSYFEKKSKNMHGAKLTLMIIGVNIQKSKIEKLFEKTLQNKFIGCLHVIELQIPSESLVIEDLVFKQLNQVCLDNLAFETLQFEPDFKDFTLHQVLTYHCMVLRENLPNMGKGVINQLNHCLATFKILIQNLLDIIYDIAKNEFHHFGASNEFRLKTQKSIDLLKKMAEIELIPVGKEQYTKEHHVQFLIDNYLQNFKIQYEKQTGSEIFAQYYDQIIEPMKDINLMVLSSKMQPLYPMKIENIQVNSQTQNLVLSQLKKQFPRDFNTQILGKRVNYSRNFIEVDVSPKPKKRTVKFEQKLSEPEPEQSQSPVIIDLDSDSEDPLAFALRIQKELHPSQETNENSVYEFDHESFSKMINEINVKLQ